MSIEIAQTGAAAVGVEQRKLDGVIRVRGAALQEQLFDFETAARLDHAPVTSWRAAASGVWKQIVRRVPAAMASPDRRERSNSRFVSV